MNRPKAFYTKGETPYPAHKQQTRGTTLESVHQLEEKYEIQGANLLITFLL
jgi:hypothetical protein